MMFFSCSMESRLPAWYELDIADEGRTLVVSLGPTAWAVVEKHLTNTYGWVTDFQQEFRLPIFVPPTEPVWGFGAVCVVQPAQREGWKAWEIKLPFFPREQLWVGLRGISASLCCLFKCLFLVEDRGICSDAQLLECDLQVGEEMGHCGIWAGVSPTLCRWLARQPDHSHHEGIGAAMRCAWARMWDNDQLDELDAHDVHALMRQPQWVNFHCVGNACGLDPHDYNDRGPDRGYSLLPHNNDSPMQQLTLLVGLAAMHHYARADGF